MAETDLYHPVKRFLEAQGYEVKAEVRDCDVVARRGGEPPVIVELKAGLTLQLLYQGIDRQALSDAVYLAVPAPHRRLPSEAVKLARMLGLGLITVAKSGSVDVHCDPLPYAPRKAPSRTGQLLREFAARAGDPNTGGSTRRPIVTAYRQDALRCVKVLEQCGSARVAEIRRDAAVARAQGILHRDVYGWFARKERGVYALTPKGLSAISEFSAVIGGL